MNDAPATAAVPWFSAVAEYMLDAWQRTVLTWDVLRERGNQALDHARSGKPPVLVFDYEPILDARTFPKPANYTLLRVKPTADQPPMDPTKRPLRRDRSARRPRPRHRRLQDRQRGRHRAASTDTPATS